MWFEVEVCLTLISPVCPLSRAKELDCLLQFVRGETPRSGLTLVGDETLGIDQYQPVGPAAVRSGDVIGDIVDQSIQVLEFDGTHAGPGNGLALSKVQGVFNDWCRSAPHGRGGVDRMGFPDVDDEELDLVPVGCPQFVQPTGRLPEGGSCVATEDQRHGTIALEGREGDGCAAAQGLKREVRRLSAFKWALGPC